MPSRKTISIPVLLILAAAAMLFRCAHPVMPVGGDQDITPPMALGAEPANFTTGFNTDKVTIYFDEFIELKDYRKEIFISPPVNKFPEFKVKGKKLIIKFEEPLLDSTTYTIYFGKSVVDITEGNPRTNFAYVFSTGNEIDSLTLSGEVQEAFDFSPVPEVLVMLYHDNNDTISLDSLPLLVKPLSAARTLEDGLFRLNNLKAEPYLIFALEDLNSNYIYDLPDERIAFLDSLVTAEYLMPVQDTAVQDSVEHTEDHPVEKVYSDPEHFYSLRMFDEVDSIQQLMETSLSPERFTFFFRLPADDITFEVVDPETLSIEEFIRESSMNNDTITFWRESRAVDTMYVRVAEHDTIVLDTVRLIFKKRNLNRRQAKLKKLPALNLVTSVRRNTHPWFAPMSIKFSRPVKTFKENRIWIVENELDTIPVHFTFIDSLQRKGMIDYTWQKGTKYFMMIPDSVFTDISGSSHDTLFYNFSTLTEENYGKLILDVTDTTTNNQYIIQLLDEKRNLIKEQIVSGSKPVVYEYLTPASYIFKAVIDENKNGQWDPGDYILKRQPEKVMFHPQIFQVRANWEVRESWVLP